MDKLSVIKKNILSSIELKKEILNSASILETAREISELIVHCYRNDGKVLFCGNGGSAADAQHLSAELSGRYYFDRPPLFSEALHVNTSYLTAVANDYSYDKIYSRLVKAMGKAGDILIGLSTSGNSQNVVNALEEAKKLKMITIGFTGKDGGKMKACCDLLVAIPSVDTPRIQECHMVIGHAVCEIVEKELFAKP